MTSLDTQLSAALPANAGSKTKSSPFASLGAPGTAVYGGYLVENEKDARLSGTQKYVTYSDILANTSIVAAGVRYFLNLIGKASWNVDPADDSPEAETLAELVKDVIHDMSTPWHRVVRRSAMYRFYGFSTQEWTAKRRPDGKIGFLDIEPRAQRTIERWDTDRSGIVVGMIQRSPQTQQELYLPRGKMVYVVDDSINDSPEGVGLFRHLAQKATTLERYELLEAWGFERDLRGTPIGRGPLSEMARLVQNGTLTSTQVSALRAPLETFVKNALKGKDTGLVLDSAVYKSTGETQQPSSIPQWTVELLRGATTSQPDMAKAIERINREMARVLGVEQLLLGTDGSGSYALAKDKSQSFGLIVSSTLQELEESYQKDILIPLWDLNGWDRSLIPSFKVEQVQYRDIEQVTSALRDMAQAGAPITPDDPAVSEVRDLLGLSTPRPEDLSLPGFEESSEEEEASPEEGGNDSVPDVEEPQPEEN